MPTDNKDYDLAIQALAKALIDVVRAAVPPPPPPPSTDDDVDQFGIPTRFRGRAVVSRRELREILNKSETWCRTQARKGRIRFIDMGDGRLGLTIAELRRLLAGEGSIGTRKPTVINAKPAAAARQRKLGQRAAELAPAADGRRLCGPNSRTADGQVTQAVEHLGTHSRNSGVPTGQRKRSYRE